jgi:hypothetical protein
MGAPINSTSNDNGLRVIQGGVRAYFTSERTGSRGWHDIWVSDWVSGEWTPPVNLGDSINSGFSDQEPTATEDDQELYFWRVGPGMQEPQIYTARKVNGVWQGARPAGWPIHWRAHWGDRDPYLLPSGNRLYYSGPEDTTGLGGGDIWYVDRLVGVEEKEDRSIKDPHSQGIELSVVNPTRKMLSVTYTLLKREGIEINLYDVTGKRVSSLICGTMAAGRQEFRRALDLHPGVYFVRLVTVTESVTRSVVILR